MVLRSSHKRLLQRCDRDKILEQGDHERRDEGGPGGGRRELSARNYGRDECCNETENRQSMLPCELRGTLL